jgi:predicted nucleic acid-binding protein
VKVYFDTNILVAAAKAEHVNHAVSLRAIARASRGEIEGYISAQGLAETYSVLTRTPFLVPVYPDEALALIQSVAGIVQIVEVTANRHLAAIELCAKAGWRGRRIHDAVHIQAAMQAGCDAIYTFDVAHFESLAGGWGGRIENPPST